jgi:excisionase family DNA binding protein
MGDEYLTVGEAQRRLGVSKPKMAQLIRDGVLATETSPLDRRVKLVRVAEVDALAARWAKKEAA